ncbi:hypothetical protein BLA29_001796, partial [Euroglyphus maynei]
MVGSNINYNYHHHNHSHLHHSHNGYHHQSQQQQQQQHHNVVHQSLPQQQSNNLQYQHGTKSASMMNNDYQSSGMTTTNLLNDVNRQQILKRDKLKTGTDLESNTNHHTSSSSHYNHHHKVQQQQQHPHHPIVIDQQRIQQQQYSHKVINKKSMSSSSAASMMMTTMFECSDAQSLYSGATSEKSASSSVRSDSPIVMVNGGNYINNDNGHHPIFANSRHQQQQQQQTQPQRSNSNGSIHQISLDSICYSSSSSGICGASPGPPPPPLPPPLSTQDSQASSSSSSLHNVHRLQQQQSFANNRTAAINKPQSIANGMMSTNRLLSPTISLLSSNLSSPPPPPSSSQSSVSSFRPTDPLPPPPLPPHRPTTNSTVPPPPPSQPHPSNSSESLSKANENNLMQIKNYITNQMAASSSTQSINQSNTVSSKNQTASTTSTTNSTPSYMVQCRPNAFSYASSASSSSPQRDASPISFANSRFAAAPANVTFNSVIGGTIPLATSTAQATVSATNSTTGLVSQVTQKLHNLNMNSVAAGHTGSTNSLLSAYSSQSFAHSPPPSYAASSSSGRQSPTPTISSSSDYASIPVVLPPPKTTHHLQDQSQQNQSNYNHRKLSSPISSTSSINIHIQSSTNRRAQPPQSQQLTGCNNMSMLHQTSSSSSETSISTPKHSLQPWSARQAISQSPIIMQSVKSQQVQKPILQTAIAPTLPPINVKLSSQSPSMAISTVMCMNQKTTPTGIATQPKAPLTSPSPISSCGSAHATPAYTASCSSASPGSMSRS